MSACADAFIIVGAGQAGAWAARTLRAAGYDGRLILCGDESHPPYERPPLSKAILAGYTAVQTCLLDQTELDALNVEFLPSTPVTRIDRAAQRVLCADGQTFDYARLLLATGGRPYLPAITGITLPGVHTLRSLDDALALRHALAGSPRVAVIGGGWIGLETAASARTLGCTVTVLEAAQRVCARSVMPPVSAHLTQRHKDAGVVVRLGVRVHALHAGGAHAGLHLTLSDGTTLEVDRVVVGTGLQANDTLARAAGVQCAHGVLVDAQCRSSDPAIYAAGDVAVRWDARTQTHLRLESWQNAQDQGIAAAQAMLDQAVDYRPLPLGWSEQYDCMIQIAGYPGLARQTHTRATASGGILYLGVDDDARVTAVVGINAGRDFRRARQWVDARTPIQTL